MAKAMAEGDLSWRGLKTVFGCNVGENEDELLVPVGGEGTHEIHLKSSIGDNRFQEHAVVTGQWM